MRTIDLNAAINPTAANPSIPRTHHEDFRLASINFVPEENYRWGSVEAMKADLARTVTDADGEVRTTYDVLKASIAASGVQEPVGLVERNGRFHVIYGFTRVAACRELNRATIPAYVYDAGISEAEIRLLQVRENSANLKRAVNWIAELEAYERLVDQAVEAYNKIPVKDRPLEDGKPMPARRAVRNAIGKVIGSTSGTMANRSALLGRLHPNVVAAARTHNWSFATCSEFYSGDATNPYTGDFIAGVLKGVAQQDRDLSKVTPERVRIAKRQVASSTSEKKMYVKGEAPTTSRADDEDRRLTPGAARDVAVEMVSALLDRHRKASSDADVEKIRNTTTWHQIVGLGMAAGDVRVPACATARILGSSAIDLGHSEATPAVLDKQHVETADRYAAGIVVHALLRNAVRDLVGDFHAWSVAMSVHDGAKTVNRNAFAASVRAALTWAAERPKNPLLAEVARTAMSELRDRLPASAFRKVTK